MPLLYDAVAAGMWVYTNAAFRVGVLGRENYRARAGTLLAITHRRETDVPLVCPPLVYSGGLHRSRSRRMSFAARQDLFEPGFFAVFPGKVPTVVRRALWRLDIAEYLHSLTLFPIRSASLIRLVDVVRALPDLGLEALPENVGAPLRERARRLGLPAPRRAGDVDRGEYADLLWRTYDREELGRTELEPAWRRHQGAATRDFRDLVEVMKRGALLQFFPEGRPSPDGDIGPIMRGTLALIRRGRPARVQPIGIAYDPLVRGRTLALVSFGAQYAPDPEDAEGPLLAALRLAVPLTAGQVVADRLARGEEPAPADLTEALEAAREEHRAIDPALADPARRDRRLAEAVAAAARSDPAVLGFLAREYRSARALEPERS